MGPPAAAVEEAVKAEAPDWGDDAAWGARFRAFSGQRADWAPRYLFWRDLFIRVARRLGVLTIRSSEVPPSSDFLRFFFPSFVHLRV